MEQGIKRSLSTEVLDQLFRQESPEYYLLFLVIDHAVLEEPIRVVSDVNNHTINGDEYTGFRFNLSLLTDNSDMPSSELTIQNVDKRIGQALRSMKEPADLTMFLINSAEFSNYAATDPVYMYYAERLRLVDVQGTALNVTGKLVSWDYAQEPYPGVYATKEYFPGLFR